MPKMAGSLSIKGRMTRKQAQLNKRGKRRARVGFTRERENSKCGLIRMEFNAGCTQEVFNAYDTLHGPRKKLPKKPKQRD